MSVEVGWANVISSKPVPLTRDIPLPVVPSSPRTAWLSAASTGRLMTRSAVWPMVTGSRSRYSMREALRPFGATVTIPLWPPPGESGRCATVTRLFSTPATASASPGAPRCPPPS